MKFEWEMICEYSDTTYRAKVPGGWEITIWDLPNDAKPGDTLEITANGVIVVKEESEQTKQLKETIDSHEDIQQFPNWFIEDLYELSMKADNLFTLMNEQLDYSNELAKRINELLGRIVKLEKGNVK